MCLGVVFFSFLLLGFCSTFCISKFKFSPSMENSCYYYCFINYYSFYSPVFSFLFLWNSIYIKSVDITPEVTEALFIFFSLFIRLGLSSDLSSSSLTLSSVVSILLLAYLVNCSFLYFAFEI